MADNVYALMPPAWLKSQFLAGIDLIDQYGQPFSDSFYEQKIRQALAYAERRLCVDILIRVRRDERHSQYYQDKAAFYPIKLNHGPLLSVEELKMNFGNTQVMVVPLQWVLVSSFRYADIKVVPVSGAPQLANILIWPIPWNRDLNPAAWRVSYTSGFYFRSGTVTVTAPDDTFAVELPATLDDSDYNVWYQLVNPDEADAEIEVTTEVTAPGGFEARLSAAPSEPLTIRWYASTIPEDLLQYIGLQAAISILPMLGSNIIGSGLGSRSISQDGLSQSFSSVGYKEQLASFQRQAGLLEASLRALYTPSNVSVR